MGLGVLDDRHLEHVPGTALLTDVVDADAHHHHGDLDTTVLRHAQKKGKDTDILLVPQPSRSPNDPLNWPLWKKDLMLFIICIDTAVVGAWVRTNQRAAVFNRTLLTTLPGTHDLARLWCYVQAVQYVLQRPEWRSWLGYLLDWCILLLRKCDRVKPSLRHPWVQTNTFSRPMLWQWSGADVRSSSLAISCCSSAVCGATSRTLMVLCWPLV